jgi:hypothetical protein
VIGPTVLALVLAAAAPLFSYRLDEVKGAVYRLPAGVEKGETRASSGDPAMPGDHLRTGWFGKLVVSVPERASRFEVASGTRVKLAGDEPGLLLVVEKGRVKAFFDALTGAEPVERRVATPGALLAVRGTRYGIEVDESGQTALAVFEGVVEVLSRKAEIPPLRVLKGEYCAFGPGVAPRAAPMGPMGINEGNWESRPRGAGQPGGQAQPGGGPGGSGAQGGSGGPGGPGNPGAPAGPGPGSAAPPAGNARGGKGP